MYVPVDVLLMWNTCISPIQSSQHYTKFVKYFPMKVAESNILQYKHYPDICIHTYIHTYTYSYIDICTSCIVYVYNWYTYTVYTSYIRLVRQ